MCNFYGISIRCARGARYRDFNALMDSGIVFAGRDLNAGWIRPFIIPACWLRLQRTIPHRARSIIFLKKL